MSAAFALIKFKKTNNIYYGCYEGTVDVMHSFICTPEECYDKKTDAYWPISYCRVLSDYKSKECSIHESDLDVVEIYADYGGGFYWYGIGSESEKRIIRGLSPHEEYTQVEIKHGRPAWVKEFLQDHE